MCFSHVHPTVRPRWHLYALEQVSVPSGLDWNRLPHKYSSRASQWNWSTPLRGTVPKQHIDLLPLDSWKRKSGISLAAVESPSCVSQLCASFPALTAVAAWGLISASVRLISAAHSVFCVSNSATNTSGISYTPSAM